MAAKGKRAWKRKWVKPVSGARCHGGGICCLTRWTKSAPGSRRMQGKNALRRAVAEA